MSSFSCYLALCGLLAPFVMSLALNAPQNADGSLTLIQPSSLLPPVNASAATDDSTVEDVLRLKATTLKDPQVDCDGRRFGNPPVASCKDVVAYMLNQQDPATLLRDPTLSYGPRGQGAWDVKLPKRYISSESLLMRGTDLCHADFSVSGWAMHH